MPRHDHLGGAALARLLPDVRTAPGPAYSALADAVVVLVRDGRVAVGVRMPSERDLSAALGLSRSTVTAAYDALRAGGFLTSRTGSGSFAAVPPGATVRNPLARWTPTATDGAQVIDLSCASPAGPPAAVAAALRSAADAIGPHLASVGYEPVGLPALRTVIADRFTARGAPTRPEQILVTNGALHAFDLLLRLLLAPGDRVVTELPTYPGSVDAIRQHDGRVVPVPMALDGGWQTEQLATTVRQTGARLAYLVPDHHNPTGALVGEYDRRAVLAAARRAGTTVVVDECFVELGFGPAVTPMAALDPTVITLGSLSKPVWGGLRIGWLRASPELVERLAAVRTGIDMGGAVLDQLVATSLVEQLDELAAARRAEALPRRDALMAALRRELPSWRFAVPQGGMSLWAELDSPISTALTVLAGQAGLILVPGPRFGVDGTLERFLRLPYSLPGGELDDAVRRLATVVRQLDGAASGAAPGRRLVVA